MMRKLSVKKYPLACRCMPTSSVQEKNILMIILIRNAKQAILSHKTYIGVELISTLHDGV